MHVAPAKNSHRATIRRSPGFAKGPPILLVVLAAATFAILLIPSLTFSWYAPRARVPLEVITVFATSLTAGLSYLRYEIGGRRSWLLVCVAFMALALNQLVFGVVLSSRVLDGQQAAFLWSVGRICAGAILLVGAFRSEPPGGTASRHRFSAPAISLLVLAAALAVQALLWALRAHLPPLVNDVSSVAPPRFLTGFQPGLTAIDMLLGLVGASLFVGAAIGFSRKDGPDAEAQGWLAAALVLAAFSHLHYMLVPTTFADHISTGDVLRLAMSVVLLVALTVDVRNTYTLARLRADELEIAFDEERRRVRRLEDIDRTRAELLRVVTHEVLHPVAAIRALALGLAQGGGSLSDDQRRTVEGLLHQSTQLRDLVESSADLLRLTPGGISLAMERWRVDRFTNHVERMFTYLEDRLVIATDRGSARAHILIDIGRMMQAFHNLLSNASNFAPPGTPIELDVDVTGTTASFEIRDHGPGIAPDRLSTLFLPRTIDSTPQRRGEGSGVGLHVTRLIVEAHGGTISTTSDHRSGAVFRIELPLTEGDAT